ncbi:PAS domain S-box protein [Pontibacter arcticus]|uniref:histidine kinase n=1 Tax=Pontibacter arcticus TaxID=2080288 RepID=A0A364REH1_9BACT|nr:PAS domain S-box protein [Pontibacter arcticus]RAU82674.1 PAS domain S-box protein [Pontibacter arcticus]
MPYTSNRQTQEQTNLQAASLLQLLVQFANPQHGLILATPAGQCTAAHTHPLASLQSIASTSTHLKELLGLNEAQFEKFSEAVETQKQVSGKLQAHQLAYTCRLLQHEGQTHICAEFWDEMAEPETAASESYKSVFENSTEPQFILSLQGNFLDVNRKGLGLIDASKKQLVGQSIFKNFKLSLFERVALKAQLKQVAQGAVQKFEWWIRDKDQDLLPIEVTLQKGTFEGQEVILGAAKNLIEVIDTEQDIRFRNHQLEFVNYLITNLSTSDSQQEVLTFTLNELLGKSDAEGGSVYTYSSGDKKLALTYSTGKTETMPLPEFATLPAQIAAQVASSDNAGATSAIAALLNSELQKRLFIVPITTDQNLLALLVLWSADQPRLTHSFNALLNFIGNTVGTYIARHQLQQQLTSTEDKYKLLFESSYDAILLFKDGVVVEFNDKALELFRCTREDLLNKSPSAFSPEYQPDGTRSDEKAMQMMRDVIETGVPSTSEWLNIRKDGTPLDSEITVSRILIDGEYYVQAFKRDITQQKTIKRAKHQEEVVNESIAQFRNFLDKVNLVHYSLDREGTIVYANDFFCKYTEYSLEELLGRNFYELLVPEVDRAYRRQEFRKVMETKEMNSYYERDVVTKSGQIKTIRWNCMIEYNAEGEVAGLTSVGKDMTDKRVAMEALKDNKIRLQDLFDNAHDLIQNISADNKFIFVNKAWKERLGYNDQDIESLTLNDIVHPYYKAKLIYQLRNLYKGENVNKIETVFLTKAGKPVHLIGSINCSWQDDRPVATRAILHDITDRIKAERLQKVYYSIANLAISSKDLNSLYSAIHRELSKIIETRNIYIALCDEDRERLNFVYLVDQFIDKSSQVQVSRPFSDGLSEHIIKTGKPLYMQKEELLQLAHDENFTLYGAVPEVILCSPLAIGDLIIGVITLQDYHNPDAYVHSDIEILHFISNQVALAIGRKRDEEQINNQNARLNAIFESGSHHMWSVNREFVLTSFNRNFGSAFEARTGNMLVPHAHMDGESLLHFHQNSFEFWKEKYEQAFQGNPQHFEVYVNEPESWREVYLNPIYHEDGTFDEISGIALDITEKKHSQLALSKNEEKFRQIFESFQDVYYRTSLTGILELISPSIYQQFGYRPEEVLGQNTAMLHVNPDDRKVMMQRLLEHPNFRDMELEMVTKDGTIKTMLLDARLVYDAEGTPIAAEGVIRDVSEIKKIQNDLVKSKEEAENLLKAKSQFLANMSHELRTPMNGIIGMIDLLTHINTDPEQSEYIDTLRKSSDALLAILNDILDLSKMQAGKLVLHETSIDLHETLGKIHALFANRAQQKDLTFTYQISPETPRHVYTDETRLLQVLSNLTSNAIKFTNAGEVSIKVDCKPLGNEKFVLQVRVKDSGIGITPEDQQLLFTDFTQLDNSSTKTFGGTGLGLAISKQLTNLLGGDIGVMSAPDTGSIFWFEIQVREASSVEIEAQEQRQQKQAAEVVALENSPHVLLVDDNQINQKVAQKQLQRLSCTVDIASNGFEAIELATANKYNIIFMDIQMPEMDGVTATGIIKEKLGTACPPIVAMTAYSMKDDAEKFMSQGMDDYVSKPVKSADLHAILSKWQEDSWYHQEEEQEAEPAAAIIDLDVLDQLKQIGGDEFARQLYEEFEVEAAELLEEAKKDMQAQQYNSILSTLHQLKGTGFTLGINLMAELAKQLEHDIKLEKFDSVEHNFTRLLAEYDNYRNAFKEIII